MKIAFISEYFYSGFKGGAEKRYFEIARYFANKNNDVHWYAGRYWNNYNNLKVDNIIYHGTWRIRNPYTKQGRRSIIKAILYSIQWLRVVKDINSKDFDLVDVSLYPFFHCFILRIFLKRNIRFVITWYEFWGNYWQKYLGLSGIIGKIIEKWTAYLPDGIIAVSQKAYQGLLDTNVEKSKLVYIPNGIRSDLIEKIIPSNITSDLIYVGRLKNHKNIDIILKIVELLIVEFKDLKVVIIGDGPEFNRLTKISKEKKLDSHIEFTGNIDSDEKVISLIKSSKIFIHPSSKEGGASMTLFEANACGKPILVLKSEQGIDEMLIKDGTNGFWLDYLEPELFVKKISELLTNNDILSEMSKSCIEFTNTYSWNNIMPKIEMFYNKVIGGENE